MSNPKPNEALAADLDRLFRRHYGRTVAALVSRLGKQHLDLAEEAAQEALAKAAKVWPAAGAPREPAAWLTASARNYAIDVLHRDARFRDREADIVRFATAAGDDATAERGFASELTDDELRMMFFCCDPAAPRAARVALTLNVVCGFRADEIARAFFVAADVVYQRIHRAKQRLARPDVRFVLPEPAQLPARVDSVLDVLYLMFNEGYSCRDGAVPPFRADLTDEAIRLAGLICRHPLTRGPQVHALRALMLFQFSRLAARIDSHGALVPLPRQDRSLWDRGRIAAGIEALAAAGEGNRAGEYHVLAGIAACHAAAESYAATDWARIARLYDELAARENNFVIEVNRAVAVAHVEGPAAGMAALASIDDARSEDYYLLAAARADLLGEARRGAARPGRGGGVRGSRGARPDRGRAAVFLVSGGGVSLGGRTLGRSTMMAFDENLAGRLMAVLADPLRVEEKRMFGGLTFMVGGHMCCGVVGKDLVVRVGPQAHAESARRGPDNGARARDGLHRQADAGDGIRRRRGNAGGRGPRGLGRSRTGVRGLASSQEKRTRKPS